MKILPLRHLAPGLFALAALYFSPNVQATTVGPDAYSYYGSDGHSRAFEDISGTGTRILAGADDSTYSADIGFSYSFHGSSYTQATISANGYLNFGANDYLYVWNQDLQFFQVGTDAVYYRTTGTPGSRRFIIQWNKVGFYSQSPSPITFEAIISESSKEIVYIYKDTVTGDSRNGGVSATVGIYGSGGSLYWPTYSTPLYDGESIAFSTDVPAITEQPEDQSANPGDTVTLTFAATSSSDMTIVWQKSGSNLVESSRISGVHSTSVIISNITAADAGNYVALVSNTNGTTLTRVARLDVSGPPVVIAQPLSQTVPQFDEIYLAVDATGTQPLGYQWQFNGNPLQDGVNDADQAQVAGSTSNTLTITGVTAGEQGNYTVVITNANGSVTSSVAKIKISAPPYVTSFDAPAGANEGESATFSVTAAGKTPMRYQWFLNGSRIKGATGSTYVINEVSVSDQGLYYVTISNSDGSVSTDAVYFSVTSIPPVLDLEPGSLSAFPGGNTTIAVIAHGGHPMTYQWQKDGYTLVGQTNATLVVSNTFANSGIYRVIIGDFAGVIVSDNIPFTVTNEFTQIIVRAGSYNGLFYDPQSVVEHTNSGFFTMKLSNRGNFSGKLLLDGDQLPFSGRFSPDGTAKLIIPRQNLGKDTLTMTLDIGIGSDVSNAVSGTIFSPSWSTNDTPSLPTINATRAVFSSSNPTLFAGDYTMTMADGTSSLTAAAYCSMHISSSGNITMVGRLPDGTSISQSVPLDGNANWPFYVPLARGSNRVGKGSNAHVVPNFKGSLFGWVNYFSQDYYNGTPPFYPGGTVNWRLNRATRLLPLGVDLGLSINGSPYQRPAKGSTVISLTPGLATFNDPFNLSSDPADTGSWYGTATVDSNNQVIVVGLPCKVGVNLHNGLISGSVKLPGQNKTLHFGGVVIQTQNAIVGSFIDGNAMGSLSIVPEQSP